jgi:hypothetical protein
MNNKLKGIFGILASYWFYLPLNDLLFKYGMNHWWSIPSAITLFIAYVVGLVWSFEKLDS